MVAVLILTLLAVLSVLFILIRRDKNPVLTACKALVQDLSSRRDYLDEETGYRATFQNLLSGYGHGEFDVRLSNLDFSGISLPTDQPQEDTPLPDLLPDEEGAQAPGSSSSDSLFAASGLLNKLGSRMTVDLEGDLRRDPEEKVLSLDVNVNAFSTDIASLKGWGKDSDLYLYVDPLMDVPITFSREHLGTQINGSGAAEYFHLDPVPDVTLPLYRKFNTSDVFGSDFFLQNAGDIEAFLMHMTLADTPKEEALLLSDDTECALLCYEMKADKDPTNDLLQDFYQTIALSRDAEDGFSFAGFLEEDPKLYFAVEDADRSKVRRIRTAEPLVLTDETYGRWEAEFDLRFLSEGVPSEATACSISLKGPSGEEWDLTLNTLYSQTKSDMVEKRSGKSGKCRNVEFSGTSVHNGKGLLAGYPADLSLDLTAKADTTDHSLTYDIHSTLEGKPFGLYVECEILDYGENALTLDLRHLRFNKGEEMLFGMTGEIRLDDIKEAPEIPEDPEAVSLFELNKTDVGKLVQGYVGNLAEEAARYLGEADFFGFGFGFGRDR